MKWTAAICLAPHYCLLLQATINVPMAEVFLEMGRQEEAHPTKKAGHAARAAPTWHAAEAGRQGKHLMASHDKP